MELVFSVMNSRRIVIDQFANISTGGPNINTGLHKRLGAKLHEDLPPRLLPFNSCGLYKCHNAFQKGLVVNRKEVENHALLSDFHLWPLVQEYWLTGPIPL